MRSRSTRPPSVPSCCTLWAGRGHRRPARHRGCRVLGRPGRVGRGSASIRRRSAAPPAAPARCRSPSGATCSMCRAGRRRPGPGRAQAAGEAPAVRGVWQACPDRNRDRQLTARVWPAIQHVTRSPSPAPSTGGGLPPRTPTRSAARGHLRAAVTSGDGVGRIRAAVDGRSPAGISGDRQQALEGLVAGWRPAGRPGSGLAISVVRRGAGLRGRRRAGPGTAGSTVRLSAAHPGSGCQR